MGFDRRVYALLADVLRFPTAQLPDQVRECVDLVSAGVPEAGEFLADFLAFATEQTGEQLEELYTKTFELSPVCYPYVGYHLFGDTHKRAAFMVTAKQQLAAQGIMVENELPDHVSFLLEYMADVEDDEAAAALLQECLIPTVRKMAESFKKSGTNPYGKVLRALLRLLERDERNPVEITGGATQ